MKRKSYTAARRGAWAAALAPGILLALTGCGGGGGSSPASSPLGVAVSPPSIPLTLSQPQSFSAVLSNTTSTSVIWSVTPGGAGGTVSSAGLYTAPAALDKSATDAIVATSTADPTRSATAIVTVTVGSAPVTVNARQGDHR